MIERNDKQALRAIARAARQAIGADERAVLAERVAGRVEELLGPRSARVILGYAASDEELDALPALARLAARGATIALPRIASPTRLSLHEAGPAQALESGPFGIRQPRQEAPLVEPDRIDIVIVPGIAFDERGYRIGFGGGYYDRLLAGMPRAFRVGIGYDSQLVGEIPAEEHDEPVDAVITPSRTILLPPGARRG